MKQKPVAFIKAFEVFIENPLKFKYFLNDLRLTLLEKKIIIAALMLRDSKFDMFFDTMKQVRDCGDPNIDFQKYFLIGIAYNNFSKFIDAKKNLNRAIEIFPDNSDLFLSGARYNLFLVASNLEDITGMEIELQALKKLDQKNAYIKIRTLICQFCFEVDTGKTKEALKTRKEICLLKDSFTESLNNLFLTLNFNLELMLGNFKQARDCLTELGAKRKFYLSSSFLVMKKLLDFLETDTSLYIYKKDFINSEVLFNEMQFFNSVQEGDLPLARKYWEKMQERNPKTYKVFGEYSGNYVLYQLVFKKITPLLEANDDIHSKKIHLVEDKNKLQYLVDTLRENKLPIKRDDLYEMIWGESPTDKNELNKLKGLLFRAKKTLSAEETISFKKGCYSHVNLKKSA